MLGVGRKVGRGTKTDTHDTHRSRQRFGVSDTPASLLGPLAISQNGVRLRERLAACIFGHVNTMSRPLDWCRASPIQSVGRFFSTLEEQDGVQLAAPTKPESLAPSWIGLLVRQYGQLSVCSHVHQVQSYGTIDYMYGDRRPWIMNLRPAQRDPSSSLASAARPPDCILSILSEMRSGPTTSKPPSNGCTRVAIVD